MTSSLESRLAKLEEANDKPVRFVLVNAPRTEEQSRHVAELEAEGYAVRSIADPFTRTPPNGAA